MAAPSAQPVPQRHWLTLTIVAALSVVLTVAIVAVTRLDSVGAGGSVIRAVPRKFDGGGSFGMLPAAAQVSISRALGNQLPAYWARHSAGGGFTTSTPHRTIGASFSATGVSLHVRGATLGISLSAFGRGGRMTRLGPVAPVASRATVTYRRSGLREWYANGPLGVEQGLDVYAPPAGRGSELTFAFTLSGSLRARRDDTSLVFETASGREMLFEDDLAVYDAAGKLLPSAFELSGGRLLVRSDVAGARYPIHVDPLIAATTPDASGPTLQNNSAANANVPAEVAASGNTVVVGDVDAGPDIQTIGPGSAWLFVEPADGWKSTTAPTATFSPGLPASTTYTQFGSSVAVTTAPGGLTTVAVGDTNVTNGATTDGEIFVYSEPAGGWPSTVNPTADLTETAGGPFDFFGLKMAMSATAAGRSTIAANYGYPGTGVDVFQEPSGGWSSTSTPTSVLAPPTTGDQISDTGLVAIATDPSSGLSTVAMSALDDATDQYEVELFREPSGGWGASPSPTATLTDAAAEAASSPSGPTEEGGLAIESSAHAPFETVFAGDTATGHYPPGFNAGAVFVYSEPSSGWASTSTATATLSPTLPAAATCTSGPPAVYTGCVYDFGNELALDSTTAIVADRDGDIWAFAQPSGGWASASGAAFAVINTNGAAWSGRTFSIAGACTDVYLGDVFTEAVDVAGDPTSSTLSCNPTLKVIRSGGGAGTVSGSKINCGSGCTASYSAGTEVTLTAKPASGSGFASWSGGGCKGTSACTVTMSSDQTVTATFQKLPVVKKAPAISGTAKPGHTLTCSQGKWSGASKFGYQWVREGVALYGNTGKSRRVATLDEGSTLSCQVTGSNKGVSKTASSKKLKVPIPFVKNCPGATGSLTGTKLGLIHLGMTQAQARRAYSHHSDRGKQYEDFFCLTPIGVRVGYASPKLLKTLSSAEQASLKNTVVWASTSNPHYALDGVRAGESVATATTQLDDTAPPLHIGLNYWYLAVKPGLTLVMKVRGHAVQEVGIASSSLTQSLQQQNTLMHSFE